MSEKEVSAAKVIIGVVRFSYATVFEPKAIPPSTDKKYSCCILIPKTEKAIVAKVKAAIEAAAVAGVAKTWKGKRPPLAQHSKMNPLRDGDIDKPDNAEYAGHYFLQANSATKPGIVGPSKQPLATEDDFYSGCYGFAALNFFAFDKAGNKGVGVGLNNLMKTKDGERLGGKDTAENDFADIEGEEDDLL